MKKPVSYIPSLIVSVILVFTIIATSALLLMDINATPSKLKNLAQKNNIESKVYSELEKYFTDKYNSTGIPAEVYMAPIDQEYIRCFEEAIIDSAFEAVDGSGVMSAVRPQNKALENSIDTFFNDFADKNNYEKDENFDLKLSNTKDNAYLTISSFCDVYKFSAMSSKGILKKAARLYSNRLILTAAAIGFNIFLIVLLIIINRKKRMTAMYWCGISAMIAGIIGAVPSIYLIATRYYDSFSIKQAAVFTAFTSAMYKLTEAFAAIQIALIVLGLATAVIYGIIGDKKKYPDTKPTQIS